MSFQRVSVSTVSIAGGECNLDSASIMKDDRRRVTDTDIDTDNRDTQSREIMVGFQNSPELIISTSLTKKMLLS